MGIPGLSTFLNQYHARYNETLLVRDTLVVIDGNNLKHYLLLHPAGVNGHLVGGDWILYSKTVRDYFQSLKNCQITPIVIFDGVVEPEKFKTKFQRLKDNIKRNVHHTMPGNSYTPVAMSTIFKEILVEQGIFHYQTEFECDDTLAYVAKRLQCPLLSSDSDFYIYPGLQNIPLSAIEFRTSLMKKDKSKSAQAQKKVAVLAAKVLALKKLCNEEFKFTDLRFLPLAAVIMGNDRISAATFGNVLKTKATDRSQRIKCIFQWLGRHKDYDHVLSVILKTVKEGDRTEVSDLVKSVLQNYAGERGELRVWNRIIQDLNLNFEMEEVGEDTTPGIPLELHTNCILPGILRQIHANQLLFLQPQVEMANLPSTHEVTLDVIRTTAGVLLGKATFTLFTRQRKNAIRIEVSTITELSRFGPIPTIEDPKFKNKAIELFNRLFELSEAEVLFVSQCPGTLRFLVMCLLYFFKKANAWSIIRPMAVAVLFLYMKPIFQCNHNEVCGVEPSKQFLTDLFRRQTLTSELSKFFTRFDTTAYFSKTKRYEISFVYVYCQFQSLLVFSIRLAKLLGRPFRLPKLQQLNSHFIYNVIDSVVDKHEQNIASFLETYFGGSSSTVSTYQIFKQFFEIVDNMKQRGSETLVHGGSQFQGFNLNEKESDASEEEEDLGETEEQLDDFISNRFSKLSVQ